MSHSVDFLTQQHERCDHAMQALAHAVQEFDWPRALAAFDETRFLLTAHMALEDNLLFPALEAATHTSEGPTRAMRHEHDLIRKRLDRCRMLLSSGDPKGLQSELEALFSLLQQHIYKEEHVVYPLCEASVEDLDNLLNDMVVPSTLPAL